MFLSVLTITSIQLYCSVSGVSWLVLGKLALIAVRGRRQLAALQVIRAGNLDVQSRVKFTTRDGSATKGDCRNPPACGWQAYTRPKCQLQWLWILSSRSAT